MLNTYYISKLFSPVLIAIVTGNKPVLYIILFLFPFLAKAQNLVPNPSFEDTVSCPYNPANFTAVASWFNPTNASPDYYNVCSMLGAGVPFNDWGYQYPQEGNAYAGFVTYSGTSFESNYREYLAIKLTESLSVGKRYFWCMSISLLDSAERFSNNVGIAFTNTILQNVNTESLLDVTIYGNHDNMVDDYIDWTLIGGTFVASGGEEYLYIGNFYPDSETEFIKFQVNDTGGPYAYYYIDDVYLGEDPCIEPHLEISNVFTPDGDGVNDGYKTNDQGLIEKEMLIFNRWGNLVFEGKEDEAWLGNSLDGSLCVEGVYFVKVSYLNIKTNKREEKTGYVHLIR